MRVGIIGNGVVGNATAEAIRSAVEDVLIYDILPERCKHTIEEVVACDLVLICLPTPQRYSGMGLDTTQLDLLLSYLHAKAPKGNYVLRSTVPVGYTRKAANFLPNICHWPEFLTARTAVEDAKNPKRNVIGHVYETKNNGSFYTQDQLVGLVRCLGRDLETFLMSSDESEFVKLMQNSFSAVKVAFFNEMYNAAAKRNLDWSHLLPSLLAGGWINPMHTQVPGPDGKRGFGGTCLPKDLSCMIAMLLEDGLDASVCSGAYARNLEDRSRSENGVVLRSSREWCQITGARVVDPDGWRAKRTYPIPLDPKSFDDPISLEEFSARWYHSTCYQPPPDEVKKFIDKWEDRKR